MTAAGAGWGGDRVVYMLLAALVPLGLLGYWACGRDLFAPGMMLVLVTAFTTGCALYNMPLWQFELSGWTVWLLVSTLAVGVVLNGLVHACARRVRIIPWQGQSRPIPAGASWAVLAVLAVVAGIMLSQIRQIAGTGFFVEVMVRFRTRNSYGTDLADQLPLWVRQLLSLAAVLEVLYLFNLFKHGKRMGRLDRALNLGVVALATLVSLLTGGRFSAMTALVAAFVLWYMLGPDGPRALRPGRMVRAALVALGALYLFYGVRVFVGRQSEQGMLEYITHYAGGSLPGWTSISRTRRRLRTSGARRPSTPSTRACASWGFWRSPIIWSTMSSAAAGAARSATSTPRCGITTTTLVWRGCTCCTSCSCCSSRSFTSTKNGAAPTSG